MNFINVLFIRSFFLLFLILIYSGNSFSQGNAGPLISSFDLPHSLRNQDIRDIAFDNSGILYISTTNRIYIFNGKNWKYVTTNGTSLIESSNSNIIYVADQEIFGVIVIDSFLNYRINSLNKILPENYNNPSDIKDILNDGESTYIDFGSKIFTLENDQFTSLEGGRNPGLYFTGERIILRNSESYRFIEKGTVSEVSYSGIKTLGKFAEHPLGILALDVETGKCYLLDNSLKMSGEYSLNLENNIRDIFYSNNHYFIIDNQNRLIIANTSGEILFKRDNCCYLSTSLFNRFLHSGYGNIWLVQDKNICEINFPTGFLKMEYNTDRGLIKDVLSSANEIYIATNKGLYFGDEDESILDFPINEIFKINEGIIAAGNKELFLVNKQITEKILNYSGTRLSYDSVESNIAYCESGGFRLVNPGKEGARSYPLTSGTIISEYLLTESNIYYTCNTGFYVLDLNSGISLNIPLPDKLFPHDIISLIKCNNEIYLIANKKIYAFRENKFIKKIIPPEPEIVSAMAFRDSILVLALKTEDNTSGLLLMYPDGRNKYMSVPVNGSSYSLGLSEYSDSSFLIYSQNELLICQPEPENDIKKFNALLTGIIAGSDTILFGISYEPARVFLRKKLNHIPYRNNSLRLSVNSSDFQSGINKLQYSFENSDSKWSEWTSENFISLKNLREGQYKVYMRVKNNQGVISEPATLSFTILPPYFRTWWAYLFYFLIIGVTLFIAYKTYILRIHRINSEPEEIPDKIINHFPVSEPGIKYEFMTSIGERDTKEKKARWDKYEMATVLFSDIQGFTRIAEQMNPELLIDELDKFFFHFDSVVDKYNIEKIKTIGDAYMAAGGIPRKNSTNPVEVVLAALEMQDFMKQLKTSRIDFWDLRIGIHSGPVIAGIIGSKKRSYDIWGDSVNTASRMESSGEAGKVNISGTTYKLIKDYFICEYRGKIPVKYKGNIDMYFVKGLRPELSVNLANIPNRKFFIKLQILRLTDLEEYVFDKLEEDLPRNMHFHNLSYAKHLYEYSGLLAKAENLDHEEILIVKTAALLMPLGYIESYQNPEVSASQIAIHILRDFYYNDQQINTISNLILSAKWTPESLNHLEKIISDIKTEYLGRIDYLKLYKLLFLERNEYLKPIESREWKKEQMQMIENHQFFTSGARQLREISSQEQIRLINEDEWM